MFFVWRPSYEESKNIFQLNPLKRGVQTLIICMQSLHLCVKLSKPLSIQALAWLSIMHQPPQTLIYLTRSARRTCT